VQESIESTDVVDPLGDNFKQQLDMEGCPEHAQQESAAVKHLCTGKGVISALPKKYGQLPKGIQKVTKIMELLLQLL
jgi:hypothetical protein